MNRRPTKSTRITVSLAEGEHAALMSLAERHDVSLSWLTRRAIFEFLQQHGKDDSQLSLNLPLQRKVGSR